MWRETDRQTDSGGTQRVTIHIHQDTNEAGKEARPALLGGNSSEATQLHSAFSTLVYPQSPN